MVDAIDVSVVSMYVLLCTVGGSHLMVIHQASLVRSVVHSVSCSRSSRQHSCCEAVEVFHAPVPMEKWVRFERVGE